MADHRGVLSQEDQEKVKQWFLAHWKVPVVCPVCKTSDWHYQEHLVTTPRHASDVFVSGATTYIYVAVSCDNCGHTLLMNAVRMGVAAPYDPQADMSMTLPPNMLLGSGING